MNFTTIVVGFCAGLVLGLAVLGQDANYGYNYEVRDKIEICEKELPRNKVCDIIAVPVA